MGVVVIGLAGARHVVTVDLLNTRLETARTSGATHTINAGRGTDYVSVTVGSAQAIAQSFDDIKFAQARIRYATEE
jgi:Zn-dependent alcohol dehydrogenase